MEGWSIWLIVALIFFLIEIFTTGIAVICFSFGALIAALVASLGGNLTWQVIFFAIVSLLSLVFIRPILVKLFYKSGKNEVKTNAEAIIGRIGTVCETIDNAKDSGRVKIDGDVWKAVSSDNEIIEEGTKVKILKLDSIIVTVKQVKN